ncbi:MAG: response regulator [Chloroflexota bacterium]
MEKTNCHTILIVDDTPESIEILRSLLRDKYRLKVALNGPRAIDIAVSTADLDLILLDVAMPNMDGYQVSAQLKANPDTHDIPVIFVSALGETLDKVRAFEAGAVDYITKPYEPEEVLARVQTHLQILELNRSLRKEIELRRQAESALQQANEMLEKRVQERTQELAKANTRLKQEIQERILVAQEKEQLLNQVRSLASHQQAIVEDERTRIARELHDEFGQNLTALKMEIAWLARQLSDSAPDQRIRLNNMTMLLDDTIDLVRRVARELRPGILDELGLLAALEWQGQEFTTRTSIPCFLDLDSKKATFGRDLDTAIFRICQEALTNIVRHAAASKVKIKLKATESEIEFSVEDNGKGITTEQVANARSFGLMGMRERVELWNGKISLVGISGKGTTVRVSIPINNGNDEGTKL